MLAVQAYESPVGPKIQTSGEFSDMDMVGVGDERKEERWKSGRME